METLLGVIALSKLKSRLAIFLICMTLLSIVFSLDNKSYGIYDEAGVFVSRDFINLGGKTVHDNAKAGLESLGYNVTDHNYQCTTRSDVENYIDKPNKNYAFFLHAHASSTSMALTNNAIDDDSLFTSNVSGYWHLVVLSGCNTGATTSWADAFRVSSGSNKAFLGFYQQITIGNANTWNSLFWNYVGDMNLRQAALEATEFTDVAGSVPVRMYGDKTWWGWAWNT